MPGWKDARHFLSKKWLVGSVQMFLSGDEFDPSSILGFGDSNTSIEMPASSDVACGSSPLELVVSFPFFWSKFLPDFVGEDEIFTHFEGRIICFQRGETSTTNVASSFFGEGVTAAAWRRFL